MYYYKYKKNKIKRYIFIIFCFLFVPVLFLFYVGYDSVIYSSLWNIIPDDCYISGG